MPEEEVKINSELKIRKYKYQIEFETIEQNVLTIAEVITETLQSNLAGSLVKVPIITFSVYEDDQEIK